MSTMPATPAVRRGSEVEVVEGWTTPLGNSIVEGARGRVSRSIRPFETDDRTDVMVWVVFDGDRSGVWAPVSKLAPTG